MNTKILIGTDDKGTPYSYDIKLMSHLLIAGHKDLDPVTKKRKVITD